MMRSFVYQHILFFISLKEESFNVSICGDMTIYLSINLWAIVETFHVVNQSFTQSNDDLSQNTPNQRLMYSKTVRLPLLLCNRGEWLGWMAGWFSF
jgi:hypothetical protein